MKLRNVPAGTGLQWVKLGIQTFFRQPLALSGLFFMFMAAVSVLHHQLRARFAFVALTDSTWESGQPGAGRNTFFAMVQLLIMPCSLMR